MSPELIAGTWNFWVTSLARSRFLGSRPRESRADAHPWKVATAYDAEQKLWTARVVPGFVNGLPAGIAGTALVADPAPLVRIRTAEPVAPPEFFRETFGPEVQTRVVRVTLLQPRPSLVAERLTDGSVRVSFSGLDALDQPARLVFGRAFVDPDEASIDLEALYRGDLGGVRDSGVDALPVASIWFASAPALDASAPLTRDWLPFPEHHCFTNLEHEYRLAFDVLAPPEPLRLPRVFGVGQRAVDEQLEFINQQNARSAALLAAVEARGQFWSV